MHGWRGVRVVNNIRDMHFGLMCVRATSSVVVIHMHISAKHSLIRSCTSLHVAPSSSPTTSNKHLHALQLVYSLDWRNVSEADGRMDRVRYDQLLQAREWVGQTCHMLCQDAYICGWLHVHGCGDARR